MVVPVARGGECRKAVSDERWEAHEWLAQSAMTSVISIAPPPPRILPKSYIPSPMHIVYSSSKDNERHSTNTQFIDSLTLLRCNNPATKLNATNAQRKLFQSIPCYLLQVPDRWRDAFYGVWIVAGDEWGVNYELKAMVDVWPMLLRSKSENTLHPILKMMHCNVMYISTCVNVLYNNTRQNMAHIAWLLGGYLYVRELYCMTSMYYILCMTYITSWAASITEYYILAPLLQKG